MGWRDFQATPSQEFMEFMESMPVSMATPPREFMESMESIKLDSPLIPLIPLIPQDILSESGGISAYCGSYAGHCSARLDTDYPAQCISTNCEHYGLPEAPSRWGVYSMAAYCPEPANDTTKHSVCPNCNGDDFWLSANAENHSVCRKCHPPAPGAEKESQP